MGTWVLNVLPWKTWQTGTWIARACALGLAGALTAHIAAATPLIRSSEQTAASVCLDYGDTFENLVALCRQALETAERDGSSVHQQHKMRVVVGDALSQLDRLSDARAEYNAVLADDATMRAAVLGLAWVDLSEGDFDAAVERFERARNLQVDANVIGGLAKAKFSAGIIDFTVFVDEMKLALAISPDDPWTLRELGWVHTNEGFYAEAARYFSDALALYPEDLNALVGRSLAYMSLDPEAALLDINRAIQIAPNDLTLVEIRAELLFNLERFRQARVDSDALIAAVPESSAGYIWTARSMFALGQDRGALDVMNSAYDTVTEDQHSLLNFWLAALAIDSGQAAYAETVIRRNLGQFEPDADDYRLLAYILIQRGKAMDAERYVDAAFELSPDWWLLHGYKAWVLALTGEPGTAMDAYARAHDLGDEAWMLEEFVSALVSKGHVIHAVSARAKFSQ